VIPPLNPIIPITLLKLQTRLDLVGRVVYKIEAQNEKSNTCIAYDGKLEEFKAYCRHRCTDDREDRYTVTNQKLHEFLFYNAFREKWQKHRRGGGATVAISEAAAEEGEDDAAAAPQEIKGLDPVDYRAVMAKYNPASFPVGEQCPEPRNGIGESAIVQYKCAVKKLWQEQVNLHINSLPWNLFSTPIARRQSKWSPIARNVKIVQTFPRKLTVITLHLPTTTQSKSLNSIYSKTTAWTACALCSAPQGIA
jgi:hypothetical protein